MSETIGEERPLNDGDRSADGGQTSIDERRTILQPRRRDDETKILDGSTTAIGNCSRGRKKREHPPPSVVRGSSFERRGAGDKERSSDGIFYARHAGTRDR